MNDILAFSLIALLLVVSPGPNGVLILKTASSQGLRASILNIFGLTTATFFHGALSIFGFSALLMQSAELFFIIKILGAGYLFYIGVKAIISSYKTTNGDTKTNKTIPSQKKGIGYFNEGFITQILNPKVSMFYLAAFPQFISPDNFSYFSAFSLVLIHASIIFMWFVGVTLAIDKIKSSAKNTKMGNWVQRLSGTAMIYFSSMILTQK
ncbi:LysE family translocator [Moritella sp.]|uniref:LysE family translocator n=1 Tax=Moritella sp. TaxID=78556 RepID=UPI001DFD1750|nr:LysE family translocator [Moritella sp.]MCJ8351315.1 LysE family translocator [Moritella sp.]NQZ42367.1 LysE family translocator [Moritella sp.]